MFHLIGGVYFGPLEHLEAFCYYLGLKLQLQFLHLHVASVLK